MLRKSGNESEPGPPKPSRRLGGSSVRTGPRPRPVARPRLRPSAPRGRPRPRPTASAPDRRPSTAVISASRLTGGAGTPRWPKRRRCGSGSGPRPRNSAAKSTRPGRPLNRPNVTMRPPSTERAKPRHSNPTRRPPPRNGRRSGTHCVRPLPSGRSSPPSTRRRCRRQRWRWRQKPSRMPWRPMRRQRRRRKTPKTAMCRRLIASGRLCQPSCPGGQSRQLWPLT
mmetsp:Transcript_31443/g.94493  ORF Transcript_31443/g.94493 Transcript_31443/m.94493 type:complete len:225 (-) Transcript_31443:1182-1856(-)